MVKICFDSIFPGKRARQLIIPEGKKWRCFEAVQQVNIMKVLIDLMRAAKQGSFISSRGQLCPAGPVGKPLCDAVQDEQVRRLRVRR